MVLIGSKDSKRTDYFMGAAEKLGQTVRLIPWEKLQEIDVRQELQGKAVKIDPPSFSVTDFPTLQEQLQQYQENLCELQNGPCRFLNAPSAILAVLDKRLAKRTLQRMQQKNLPQKIAVTELLAEKVHSVEEFFQILSSGHCSRVFIKPVYFSGAAGVSAFRMQPNSDRMQLYTSAVLRNGILHNTKRLFRMEDRQEILEFLRVLFQTDVIVERWYPKDTLGGQAYDLRVVHQFGHVAYMVVRKSAKGPITNLHLNNQAESIEALHLTEENRIEIEQLCKGACLLFPGLQMAGMDIMLDKGSRKPRIIEINGQGDLIYQDIYDKNCIYEEQIIRMGNEKCSI